jgi:uncharacterized membrane protein
MKIKMINFITVLMENKFESGKNVLNTQHFIEWSYLLPSILDWKVQLQHSMSGGYFVLFGFILILWSCKMTFDWSIIQVLFLVFPISVVFLHNLFSYTTHYILEVEFFFHFDLIFFPLKQIMHVHVSNGLWYCCEKIPYVWWKSAGLRLLFWYFIF